MCCICRENLRTLNARACVMTAAGDTKPPNGASPESGCYLRAVFGFQSQSADALPPSVGGHAGSFVDLQVLVKSVSSGSLTQENTMEVWSLTCCPSVPTTTLSIAMDTKCCGKMCCLLLLTLFDCFVSSTKCYSWQCLHVQLMFCGRCAMRDASCISFCEANAALVSPRSRLAPLSTH